jgi:hypothetical protein
LVVAIYTHSYIPTTITKEQFQTEIELDNDQEDPEYIKAVADEEEANRQKELQREREQSQKNAMAIRSPKEKSKSRKASPKRAKINMKTDRYVPPDAKNVDDDIRKAHEKFHAQIERNLDRK